MQSQGKFFAEIFGISALSWLDLSNSLSLYLEKKCTASKTDRHSDLVLV
jgi:hypothetical protein